MLPGIFSTTCLCCKHLHTKLRPTPIFCSNMGKLDLLKLGDWLYSKQRGQISRSVFCLLSETCAKIYGTFLGAHESSKVSPAKRRKPLLCNNYIWIFCFSLSLSLTCFILTFLGFIFCGLILTQRLTILFCFFATSVCFHCKVSGPNRKGYKKIRLHPWLKHSWAEWQRQGILGHLILSANAS